MNFSEEQILSMAPDESSKKSGKELANASKWGKRELSDRALWGECQGSGKLPYQTQVDLVNIAFKCSCPSRKFPCKHGLGLLLLFVRDKKLFSTASEPDWVTGWLDKRNDREEKKEKTEKEKKVDPVAAAKRQESRVKRVEDGMEDLRLWVKDIIRNGLLAIPSKDPTYFETMSKRMVDAQAPGLAAMIRTLREINFYQEGWQTPFLDQIIRIFLVLEGFRRMDELPASLQDELKTCIGFTQNQDELKLAPGVRDDWYVLAKQTDKEENLTIERNWLYGVNSNRYALILQFYVRGQLPEVNLLPGSCIDAELVYFKGANPIRVLVKEQFAVREKADVTGLRNWSTVADHVNAIRMMNPWTNGLPVIIENVRPLKNGTTWMLKDEDGHAVMISPAFTQLWKLMSISGGKPLRLFAVGNENYFEPMGAWVGEHYTLLV